MMAASQLTLAEQLYLLAYDEGTCLSGPDGALLGAGLAGVLLSTPRSDPTGPGMIQTRPRDPGEDEARLIALLELLDMIEPLVPPDRRMQARRRAEHLAGQGSPPSAGQATVCFSLSSP